MVCINACMHASIHPSIPTYIHTYIWLCQYFSRSVLIQTDTNHPIRARCASCAYAVALRGQRGCWVALGWWSFWWLLLRCHWTFGEGLWNGGGVDALKEPEATVVYIHVVYLVEPSLLALWVCEPKVRLRDQHWVFCF